MLPRARARRSPAALVLALAVAVATSGCGRHVPARPRSPAAERKAFLWEVTRPEAPGRPLYLTGSMHAGRAGAFLLPPSFRDALARADALVVEVDPEAVAPDAIQSLVLQIGTYPAGERLSAHLDADSRERLAEAVARAGLPLAGVERMRPWLVSTMLETLELQRAGFDPRYGLDAQLLDRVRGQKQVVELESAAGQVRTLAGLPDDLQVAMLVEQLRTGGDTAAEATRMAEAWDAGDTDAFEELTYRHAKDPELAPLYESIFWSRNRAMADRLAAYAGAPRVHLAVIGAGHLVGDRGVLALLRGRGLVVRQMPRE